MPYNSKKINYIEIFNETVISLSFYFCYLFTDFVDADKRYALGWIFIFLILANFTLNFLGIIINTAIVAK
jgi:hypothetical protein